MTATTKTFIVSQSLMLLGHKPIISLENADQMTVAASQAFDMLLPQILSQGNWRFAVAIQPLVQSLEIPPAPWGAVFNLPSGFLKLIRLYPNIYGFDIYHNKKLYTILRNFDVCSNNPPPTPPPCTNPCQCHGYQPFSIEYIYQPDINQLPPHFVGYFVYEIAKFLALSSAQRPDYANYLKQECAYQFAMAAAVEAQNRPQYSQVLFPILTNRMIGGFIGNSSGAY